MPSNKKVLISGAGIGGLTAAFFLHEYGFTPVVIEKSSTLRDNGYMIDFFSSGIHVSEQMGIIHTLQEKDHGSNIIKQFNEKHEKSLSLDISGLRQTLKGRFFNFLRTDLVDILYQKIKDRVEIRFSTSVRDLSQDAHSVKVIFDDGQTENFDLLIGADGIHSNVRQLTYKAQEVHEQFLGYHVAGLQHDVPLKVRKGEVLSMLAPKRQIMTYTSGSNSNTSLFVFQSGRHGHLTTKEKVKILRDEFSAFVSPVPEILDQATKEKRLFFDEITQIRIAGKWSKGRIVLVGDAAYCITLLSGQGASMAMTGAFVLAKKLSETNGNYNKAFEEYESDLRPFIERMQQKAVKNAATYLPATKFKLWIRNLLAPIVFTKLFSPLIIKQLGAGNYFAKRQ